MLVLVASFIFTNLNFPSATIGCLGGSNRQHKTRTRGASKRDRAWQNRRHVMNRLRMLLMGTALIVAGSALASAQPRDDDRRHDGRFEHRDHDRDRDRDRDRHFDRDRDRRFDRDWDRRRHFDRDDRRFVDRRYYYDRDYRYVPNYYSYRVGE